jgi:6-phosphogluconolactonase
VVARDADGLARAVAERIVEISRRSEGRPVSIALSGGSTPRLLYRTLARDPFRSGVAWDRLEIFFGDERSVPPEDPASNFGNASRELLADVAARVHPMPVESGDAEAYERLVRGRVAAGDDGLPAFDLILLGIGGDGHTASLFPGTAALREERRLVVVNEVPERGFRRMTFTYPLLNAARRVWVLASGADKREVVARAFAASGRRDAAAWLPVLGVRPRSGELVWWLDEAAHGARGGGTS